MRSHSDDRKRLLPALSGLTRLSCCEKIGTAPSVRAAFLPRSGPVAQLGARFHGMEEVVGSIPTRSTKSLNNLDGAPARGCDICVVVCVVTRRFGAYGEGFKRIALGFHAHVAISLQHATADVTGNRHDGRVRSPVLRKLRNRAMPEIVESE